MKKFISLLLSILLIMSTQMVNVSAKENHSIDVMCETQEEYDQIVAAIEAHNREALRRWNLAQQEAKLPENAAYNVGSVARSSVGTLGGRMVDHDYTVEGAGTAQMRFSTTFYYSEDLYGNDVFGEIRTVDAYARNDNTRVEMQDCDYSLIDRGKTLACNYTCRVGIKNLLGNFSYYTYITYVEFYITGGGAAY